MEGHPYDCGVPLVADMSSDILSRVLDFNKFDLDLCRGAKEYGCSWRELFVVVGHRKYLGERIMIGLFPPCYWIIAIILKEASMPINTPPVFCCVCVAMLTLRWLKKQGGVAALEENSNDAKAKLFLCKRS